jgi:hypothetical protein
MTSPVSGTDTAFSVIVHVVTAAGAIVTAPLLSHAPPIVLWYPRAP